MRQARERREVGEGALGAARREELVVVRGGRAAAARLLGGDETRCAGAQGAHEPRQAAELEREPRAREVDDVGLAGALGRALEEHARPVVAVERRAEGGLLVPEVGAHGGRRRVAVQGGEGVVQRRELGRREEGEADEVGDRHDEAAQDREVPDRVGLVVGGGRERLALRRVAEEGRAEDREEDGEEGRRGRQGVRGVQLEEGLGRRRARRARRRRLDAQRLLGPVVVRLGDAALEERRRDLGQEERPREEDGRRALGVEPDEALDEPGHLDQVRRVEHARGVDSRLAGRADRVLELHGLLEVARLEGDDGQEVANLAHDALRLGVKVAEELLPLAELGRLDGLEDARELEAVGLARRVVGEEDELEERLLLAHELLGPKGRVGARGANGVGEVLGRAAGEGGEEGRVEGRRDDLGDELDGEVVARVGRVVVCDALRVSACAAPSRGREAKGRTAAQQEGDDGEDGHALLEEPCRDAVPLVLDELVRVCALGAARMAEGVEGLELVALEAGRDVEGEELVGFRDVDLAVCEGEGAGRELGLAVLAGRERVVRALELVEVRAEEGRDGGGDAVR